LFLYPKKNIINLLSYKKMKKNNFKRKLSLNKETIAQLDKKQLNEVKGGADSGACQTLAAAKGNCVICHQTSLIP